MSPLPPTLRNRSPRRNNSEVQRVREAQTKEPNIMDEIKRLNGVRDALDAIAFEPSDLVARPANGDAPRPATARAVGNGCARG